jgi:hypothetical protein
MFWLEIFTAWYIGLCMGSWAYWRKNVYPRPYRE